MEFEKLEFLNIDKEVKDRTKYKKIVGVKMLVEIDDKVYQEFKEVLKDKDISLNDYIIGRIYFEALVKKIRNKLTKRRLENEKNLCNS